MSKVFSPFCLALIFALPKDRPIKEKVEFPLRTERKSEKFPFSVHQTIKSGVRSRLSNFREKQRSFLVDSFHQNKLQRFLPRLFVTIGQERVKSLSISFSRRKFSFFFQFIRRRSDSGGSARFLFPTSR